jgi:hypothetical protein
MVGVKVINRLYKPEISLLNQVTQTHPPAGISLGDINNQSEVASHQSLSRTRVVLLDDKLA